MSKKIPKRMCISCREMKEKTDLFRVVKVSETLVIDHNGKMNCRGAYICRNNDCLTKALKNRGIERSFKCGFRKGVIEDLIKEMKESIEE